MKDTLQLTPDETTWLAEYRPILEARVEMVEAPTLPARLSS